MCDGDGHMSPGSHLPRESQIDLPESDDTNRLQTHLKHFLFAVPSLDWGGGWEEPQPGAQYSWS